MRKSVLMAMTLVAALGATIVSLNPIADAAGNSCLRIRDLGNLKPIDDTTLLATTRNQGNYTVKLRHPCRDFRQIDNYYVLRAMSNAECFDGDDVLEFRYGGVCFVESVTPVH